MDKQVIAAEELADLIKKDLTLQLVQRQFIGSWVHNAEKAGCDRTAPARTEERIQPLTYQCLVRRKSYRERRGCEINTISQDNIISVWIGKRRIDCNGGARRCNTTVCCTTCRRQNCDHTLISPQVCKIESNSARKIGSPCNIEPVSARSTCININREHPARCLREVARQRRRLDRAGATRRHGTRIVECIACANHDGPQCIEDTASGIVKRIDPTPKVNNARHKPCIRDHIITVSVGRTACKDGVTAASHGPAIGDTDLVAALRIKPDAHVICAHGTAYRNLRPTCSIIAGEDPPRSAAYITRRGNARTTRCPRPLQGSYPCIKIS